MTISNINKFKKLDLEEKCIIKKYHVTNSGMK